MTKRPEQVDPSEINDHEAWRRALGRKVTMRARLHGDPAHSVTEAIGVVQSVGPDENGVPVLTVIDRKGESHTIAVADILAAKIL